MPQLTATEAAAQENQRVMGILTCQEAKGREQLATMLAGQQGMSVEQARAILAAAAPQQPVASTQSEADRIMACEEANGREQLAATLAAMPEMTVEKARPIRLLHRRRMPDPHSVIRSWHWMRQKGLRRRLNSWLPARE